MPVSLDQLAECAPLNTLLAEMAQQARDVLARQARAVRVAADTALFHPGEACTQYLIVLEGAVRVQLRAENGREIMLYRVGPGQTCVLTTMALLSGAPYEAEGRTETDVRALALPVAAFDELLATSGAFRRFVFSALAMRISDLMHLVGQVAFARLDARLAAFLLHHVGGSGRGEGCALRMTHQDIAAELGASREAVSRLLKGWERQGLVRLGRAEVRVVDAAGLRRLLGNAMD